MIDVENYDPKKSLKDSIAQLELVVYDMEKLLDSLPEEDYRRRIVIQTYTDYGRLMYSQKVTLKILEDGGYF